MRWYRHAPPTASAASRQRHLPISLGFLGRCQTFGQLDVPTRQNLAEKRQLAKNHAA